MEDIRSIEFFHWEQDIIRKIKRGAPRFLMIGLPIIIFILAGIGLYLGLSAKKKRDEKEAHLKGGRPTTVAQTEFNDLNPKTNE